MVSLSITGTFRCSVSAGIFASCLWNGLYWDCRLSSSVISDFNHAALKFPPTNVLEYLGVILVDGFDAYTWRRRHIIGIMHLSLLNYQLICKQSDFFIINYLYVGAYKVQTISFCLLPSAFFSCLKSSYLWLTSVCDNFLISWVKLEVAYQFCGLCDAEMSFYLPKVNQQLVMFNSHRCQQFVPFLQFL